VDAAALRGRIEEHIRRHDLVPPRGDVVCLVSGGPDSTCLWHALGALDYRVEALHVNHRLRGEESEADARFCRERLGAEVVEAPPANGGTEAELRELRYEASSRLLQGRIRATGHTASDQVETILYRLAASGTTTGIRPRRDDGVVRPLLTVSTSASTPRTTIRCAASSGGRSFPRSVACTPLRRRTSFAPPSLPGCFLGRSRERC
jgi:tRNA(Ile)-lysidine synthase